MALAVGDRVKHAATTTGTGTFTLGSAPVGFQTAGSVLSNGDTTYYTIQHGSANEWEVGLGTYTASGTTLARTTVLSSSNSGSAVDFSAGDKDVFITLPASKSIYLDGSGNATALGTIGSGTWQGTAIADAYIGTLSASDKVSGSAVQLSSTSALENSTGLRVKNAIAGTGLSEASQVLSVDASQTQITALGTIGTGTWQGTAIADAYIGTIATSDKVSGSAVQLSSTSALENSTGLRVKSAIAGAGLTLSSQVLTVDAAQTQITSIGTIATGTWAATDVAVIHGGTGSSTAAGARANLGVQEFTGATSAPGSPAEGDEWYDTNSAILYKRVVDSSSNAVWVDISGSSAAGGMIASLETTSIGTSVTTIQEFGKNLYRSAKMIVEVTDVTNTAYRVSEVLILHDGTNAHIVEYGVAHSGASDFATLTVDISGANVRLRCVGTSANNTAQVVWTKVAT